MEDAPDDLHADLTGEPPKKNPHEPRIRLRVAIAAFWHSHKGAPKPGHPMPWAQAVAFFAEHAVSRHPRTVERWLDEEAPIPKAVQRAIQRVIEEHTDI